MKVCILGLTVTSSWGNGHATNYRALMAALEAAGHDVMFLERDMPWYAAHRDLPDPPWGRTHLYGSVAELRERHADDVREADLAIVGSYVPDGVEVGHWVCDSARGVPAFYDIDTPVTLSKLERGDHEYLEPELVRRYRLYLSFTAGPTLERITEMGALRPVAFHCFVDPERYHPLDLPKRWDLGYLGTYSDDRQPALERLLLEPARRDRALRFVVAGPQFPDTIDWPDNVERIEHLPPAEHPAFYAAQRYTLNVTRADMVRAGWSPSVRLFEAAACATPVISDVWAGIETFFTPCEEIILARGPEDVLHVLQYGGDEMVGVRARARVLAEHTAARRVATLERLMQEVTQTA